MKKGDLIKIIREIVRQEIKKELPNALAQMFSSIADRNRPDTDITNTECHIDNHSKTSEKSSELSEETERAALLREQLRDMFNDEGGSIKNVARPQIPPQYAPMPKKQFTKDPILNDVLNQTRPFNQNERMAMGVGGMSPSVMMAADNSGYTSQTNNQIPMTGTGQLMDEKELGFLSKIPGMPGSDAPFVTEPLTQHKMQSSISIPDSGEVSALDLKNNPALPKNIRNILTRDYRSLVRAMDKKK